MRNYLGLYERLSQLYLDRAVAAVVLSLLKLLLFRNLVVATVDANKDLAERACDAVNDAVNIQNHFSRQINLLVQHFITAAANAFNLLLQLIITVAKNLTIFYIELYLGTYTCLFTAMLKGSLDLLTEAVSAITDALNVAVNAAIEDIQRALGGLSDAVNSVISAADKVRAFFAGSSNSLINDSFKTVNLTLSGLHSINISHAFVDELTRLNDNIPNFDNLTNITNTFIEKPFSAILKELAALVGTGNFSLKLRPLSETANTTACNPTGIEPVFDEINRAVSTTFTYIVAGLCGFLVLLLLLLAYKEHRKWSRFEELIETVAEHPTSTPNTLNVFSSFFLYRLNKVNFAYKDEATWLFSYTFLTSSALMLLIGVTGFMTVLLQYIVLRVLKSGLKKLPLLLAAISADIAEYVDGINDSILSEQASLNGGVLGSVRSATGKLNSTLTDFMGELQHALNSTFGGTVFMDPVNAVVYCTIGRKVDKIEEGLGWISDNLELTLPTVPALDFGNLKDTALGNSASEALQKTVSLFERSLKVELLISAAFVGIWALQLFIGLAILLYRRSREIPPLPGNFYPVDVETVGPPRPLTEEQRRAYSYPFVDPYSEKDPSSSKYSEKLEDRLTSDKSTNLSSRALLETGPREGPGGYE